MSGLVELLALFWLFCWYMFNLSLLFWLVWIRVVVFYCLVLVIMRGLGVGFVSLLVVF